MSHFLFHIIYGRIRYVFVIHCIYFTFCKYLPLRWLSLIVVESAGFKIVIFTKHHLYQRQLLDRHSDIPDTLLCSKRL